MSKIISAQELKDYALRELGKPVINIEIDDTQMDDRIKDTIDEFLEFHIDGYEKAPLIYEIRKSDYDNGYLTLPSNIISVVEVLNSSDSVSSSEAIDDYQYQVYRDLYWSVWSTSGGTGTGKFDLVGLNTFRTYIGAMEKLLSPEITFSFNPVSKKLKTNRQLNVREYKYTVSAFSDSPSFIEVEGDISGIAAKDREASISGKLYTISSVNVDDSVSPSITKIEFKEEFEDYSINPAEIFIYTGNIVAMIGYTEIDLESNSTIYNQLWIRSMVVERFREQWGSNLRKYKNVKLPGGVQFNGEEIYKEAKENVKELREELHSRYSEPIDPDFG